MATQTDTSTSEQAILDCLATYRICRATAAYGTSDPGDWATPDTMKALHDCADINLVLVELLSRGSLFSRSLSRLCAQASATCADALEPFEHTKSQLRVAFAACRRSHQVCSFLSGALPEEHFDPRDIALQDSFPASDPPPPPTEL